jgi:hypothetical protein
MNMRKRLLVLVASWFTFVWSLSTMAQVAPDASSVQQGISTRFSGFLSIDGGEVLSGSFHGPMPNNPAYSCPCYLADWTSTGMYSTGFSFKPETRAGVQADIKFNDQFSFTAQVTDRADDTSPQLQWAFLTYDFMPNWELTVGRKRIPLYYYSNFQDVGIAYPWVTPPPELYGWEVTNYNGVSLRYNVKVLGFRTTSSVFTGTETVLDDRYYLSGSTDNINASWKNIWGADTEWTKDWLTMRLVYLLANASTDDITIGARSEARVHSYGIAINADFDDWFVLSEFTADDRSYNTNYYVNAPALSVGAGYRFGAWTPFLNYGWYYENTNGLDQYPTPARYKRTSLTLRYDLNPTTAFKLQWDNYEEAAISNLTGNSKVLRIAFDKTF